MKHGMNQFKKNKRPSDKFWKDDDTFARKESLKMHHYTRKIKHKNLSEWQ